VRDGCTAAPPPVVAGVGNRGRPTVRTTGPVGIRRTANTATTRPYPAKRRTVKYKTSLHEALSIDIVFNNVILDGRV